MTREEVYKLIDGEREYQEKWERKRRELGFPSRSTVSVEAWILWMDVYLQKAKLAATESVDKTKALEAVRKVAALAVACMESNDTPARFTEEGSNDG